MGFYAVLVCLVAIFATQVVICVQLGRFIRAARKVTKKAKEQTIAARTQRMLDEAAMADLVSGQNSMPARVPAPPAPPAERDHS